MKKFTKVDLRIKKSVFLFLDFDGTLAPIVGNPADAKIMPASKKWLQAILKNNDVKIAIVTGRSLKDIRQKIGLKKLYYLANHGLEAFYNGRFLLKKGCRFERSLKSFGDEVKKAMARIPGIFIEEKGLSVAVHFRGVERKHHALIRSTVKAIARPFTKKHGLHVTKGKMILELRPALVWNKGKAVKWLLEKTAPEYFPVYIGDDATDEDAFLALRPYGLTIRVGEKVGSYAQYYINSIREFINIL